MEKEIWRPIKGYEGLYEVSNLGRVKSIERYILSGKGYGLHKYGGKVLKSGSSNGYLRVSLCKDKHIGHFSVHRLVAEAFIPNPDSKPEIDHINTVRNDNRVENLQWVTKQENARNPISSKKRRDNWRSGAEKLKGRLNKKSIPIVAVNIKTGEVVFYDCLKDAFRNGFNLGHVCECIHGKRPTHKGFKWMKKKVYNLNTI